MPTQTARSFEKDRDELIKALQDALGESIPTKVQIDTERIREFLDGLAEYMKKSSSAQFAVK